MVPTHADSPGSAPRVAVDANEERIVAAKRALVALLGTADSVRRFMGRVVGRHGLTLQQFNVLRILRGAHPDPLPSMEIAERMIEKSPGITRFLDCLEDRGLLRRERCPDDRRMVHAWITEAGLGVLAAMDEAVIRADLAAVDGIPSQAIDGLVGSLERIRRNTD